MASLPSTGAHGAVEGLRALAEATGAILGAPDLHGRIEAITRHALTLTGASRVEVLVPEGDDGLPLRCEAGEPPGGDEGLRHTFTDREGRELGTLQLQPRAGRPFTDLQASIARQLAHLGTLVLEQQRAAAELRADEARYRRLLDTSRMVAFEGDPASGRFTWVGPRAEDLLGYPREAWFEPDFRVRVVHPDDRERVMAEATAMEASPGEHAHEFRLRAADGRVLHVRSVVTVEHADGRPVAVRGLMLDITEQRRFEHEMLRVSRLDSVALLAGGIAHDFNNLLTAILGNIALARIKAGAVPPVVERLDAAERACAAAKGLTSQLLTFARGGEPVKQRVALPLLLQDACSFALQGAEVGGQVECEAGLAPIEADPDQVRQVVHNLVLNAVQATPGAGTVRVCARNVDLDDRDALPLPPGPYVQVEVRDQGVGIPPEALPRVFDLFFTTRDHGSGLGLATAHSVVRRHGGHITVASERGKGSTFTFWLPAAEGDPDPPEGSERPLARGSGRVLVMDDEPAVREVARVSLEHLGYQVEEVADGEEAVARYQQAQAEGRPFRAVLLDLTIPGGLGGRATLERLRALDPLVRAVVASGYSTAPILAEHRSHGFVGAVSKPYRVHELAVVLGEVLSDEAG